MAQFITRVELHGAIHGDGSYDILHSEMEANGFKRTITAADGKVYQMLTAEYEISGNYTADSIIQSAKDAAELTGKLHSVFVSELYKATWWNLKQV